jgi:cell division protein ZapA
MSAKSVDVQIMGREFSVACTDEERQGLLEAVNYLNKKMLDIRDAGKVVGVERIAIMAALNLSHEVLNTSSGDINVGDYKRRIHAMQHQIDEAIAIQTPLL